MDSRGKAWAVGAGAASACLALGWALGTWTTCGEGCRYDAETFGALGTWVGGLGTIAAVVFAARSFSAETRARERQDAKDAQARETTKKNQRNDAEKVYALVKPGAWSAVPDDHGNRRPKNFIAVVNNDAHTAPALKVDIDLEGFMAKQIDEVAPNGYGTTGGIVSQWVRLADTEDAEADAMTQVARLTFTMHGIRWARVGQGPVEEVEDLRT